MKGFIATVALLAALAAPVSAQVSSVTLQWTAPGDDGAVGTAGKYDMRWSSARPDTANVANKDSWWLSATPVTTMPAPTVAGTMQSVAITPTGGFIAGSTYYFVIRTGDEIQPGTGTRNWSGWSNVAWVAVQGAGDVSAPRPVVDLRPR